MRLQPARSPQCGYLTTVYSPLPAQPMAGLMGTDKLKAEESEAYFRVLIESAPDAFIGLFTGANTGKMVVNFE